MPNPTLPHMQHALCAPLAVYRPTADRGFSHGGVTVMLVAHMRNSGVHGDICLHKGLVVRVKRGRDLPTLFGGEGVLDYVPSPVSGKEHLGKPRGPAGCVIDVGTEIERTEQCRRESRIW